MLIKRFETRQIAWFAMRSRCVSTFKDKPKKFYSYMRQTQTVKVQVTQLEKTDGTVTEYDKEAADELCMFFKSVFIDDQDLTLPQATMHNPPAAISVSATCFSRDSVLKKLKGLH